MMTGKEGTRDLSSDEGDWSVLYLSLLYSAGIVDGGYPVQWVRVTHCNPPLQGPIKKSFYGTPQFIIIIIIIIIFLPFSLVPLLRPCLPFRPQRTKPT